MRDSVRLEMVAMAVVMPSQNSCIVASTYEVPCAYRALVKPISLQSVAASRRSRNGNGRTAVFSSGGVLSKEIPVCSSDIRSRYEDSWKFHVIRIQKMVTVLITDGCYFPLARRHQNERYPER